MANTIFLQELRQYNSDLSDNDLLLFKIKKRVDMPADEDMGVRYSHFLTQLNLERFVKKAGDTMSGDLVFVSNRGLFGTTTTGQTRSIFKLDNTDRVVVGNQANQLVLNANTTPKLVIGAIESSLYHSGNSNTATIDWMSRNLLVHQNLTVNGESVVANITIKKLSSIYGYDAGNLKVRMIGIDADDDVAVGVTTKRFGILVKDPNEVWAVQEEGNPAKQWRVLTTGNFTAHLDNIYVLKTQTINGKALAGSITLNAADVDALALTGGTLTGQTVFDTNNPASGSIADIFHRADGVKGQRHNLRVMRENAGAAWLWEQVADGSLHYTHGVNGARSATIRMNVVSGEIFLQDGTKRAYHQGFKPTFTDVGAAPAGYGIGETALSKVAKDQVLGGLWGDASITSAGITLPYDGSPSQAFIKVDMNRGVLSFGTRAGNTSTPINWRDVYSVNNKPTANDLNVYTKQEVDAKVRKTITVNAPTGVVAGKYYPILFKNSNKGTYVRVVTRGSGASDPMNTNTFEGNVQSGGWTDVRSYCDGFYTTYDLNEIAVAGVVRPTENGDAYAFYVEARAFPVTVTVDSGIDVSTSSTNISYNGATYNAGIGVSDSVGTKVEWLATFRNGNGHYINSDKINPSGGSGATFGQVSMFLTVPDEPWIPLDGRAFDPVKYPRLAQLYPSGHVPNVTGRYPKFWSGSEGAGTAYGGVLPSHNHSFSANTSSFDYGTKNTSSFDYGTKSATTNYSGDHTHTIAGDAGNGTGGTGSWKYPDGSTRITTRGAGNHAHSVSIGIGAHSHSVGIGAHSHSVSGTTSAAGTGSKIETDRFVFYACIYAA